MKAIVNTKIIAESNIIQNGIILIEDGRLNALGNESVKATGIFRIQQRMQYLHQRVYSWKSSVIPELFM
ncbi:MAG: hypothetical protein DRP70_00040 [Spirochaetes bacterium]|nr:MAG: hypothetical protein DRP49_04600 [Spirochaetota bacterium]RKX80214.1 MAG: hypothetical protein DRP60_03725 [Spirochaetota bacterium]RKX90592.1 MAG: hypothetical protein DRP70_00040 [Spirochaetota bacterium]RKX98417.1 MAG: hypothetical protein DRZ90_02880 [Spirochaetota bacterium]